MEQIKETIFSVMQRLDAQNQKNAHTDPEALLKKILTKREFSHIKVDYFKEGIVGISVSSSVWLHALSLKKRALALGLSAGNPAVKDIRFRIGKIDNADERRRERKKI